MYKKIAAGVLALALTLSSGAVPAEMFAKTGLTVSVSAAETYNDFTYSVLSDNTIEIIAYNGTETQIVIPEEIDGMKVSSIGEKAFYRNQTMTGITLPSTLKSIGTYAFYYCKAMTAIDIPDSVEFIDISAFQDCDGLKSVKLPDGITAISDRTFNGCDSLESVEISKNVKSIGSNAFCWCKALDNVTIPDSVTSIGDNAFSYCSGLNNISIPDSVEFAGRNIFNGTPWLNNQAGLVYVGKVAYKYIGEMPADTEINLKDGTTYIGAEAFKNCSLSKITMPDTVKSIGNGAFYKTNISEIKLSKSLTTIGSDVFYGCTSLKSVDVPESVTSIGDNFCSGCTTLESVVLPDGITELSSKMFSECANLKNVNIPSNLTKVCSNAFNKCVSLEVVDLPESVTEIETYAFRGCTFKSIKIPNGVSSLSANTLYECPNLEQVILPDGLTTINTRAIYLCPSLKSIEIPDSVTTIGNQAFGYYKDEETKKIIPVKDFTVICGEGSAAETYAKNNNMLSKRPEVSEKTDISACTITLFGSKFDYTGKEIKPAVTVKNGDKTLTAGTDYTVVYSNNVNAGTATVTITGAGNYKGTVKKTFTIVKNDPVTKKISDCQITLSAEKFVYTGSAVKPKVTVKDGTKTLTVNTDYAIRYVNNVNVGTGSVVVAGRGNYTGSVTKTFSIVEEITDLSECSIKLNKTMFKSTGKAIKPRVIVKSGSKTLVSGTDYLVRYMNNVNPGTASVIVAGRGKYTGRVTLTFKILDSNAKDINQCSVTLNKTKFSYTGKAVKPRVTVKDGDTVLTATVDYNVKYVDNVNAGTAKVVVSGTGKYQGMVEKTFIIQAK